MPKSHMTQLQESIDAVGKAMGQYETDKHQPLIEEVCNNIKSDNSDLPFILKAQKYLSVIRNLYDRKKVAYRIEEKLPAFLRELDCIEDFIPLRCKEFRSLIHYFIVLESGLVADEDKQKYEKFDKAHVLEVDTALYHLIIGWESQQKEFLTYSQAFLDKSYNPDYHVDPVTLPVYANMYDGQIIAMSVTEFCSSLLNTLYLRRTVIDRKNDIPPMTTKHFPLEARNYCFDEYIKSRAASILFSLKQNNDRQNLPTLREAKIELLKKEVQNYNKGKEEGLDENVMRMAEYFIGHLREDLGFDTPHDEIDPASEELNVNNESYEIDKRIKAVYKAKICKYKADWAVIFKILVERGFYVSTDCTAAAARINRACGKQVTTASAIRQAPIMTNYSGKWEEGWTDKVHNLQSAGLLIHYEDIARVFTQK